MITGGAIILVKVIGHFVGLPSSVGEQISDTLLKLALGYVAAEGIRDTIGELKNDKEKYAQQNET